MIILIGIEGTYGDANDPDSGYTGSFVHRLVRDWPDQETAQYIPGPESPDLSWHSHASTLDRARRAVDRVLELRKRADVRGVFLAGYSLGGASAIEAAKRLGKQGVKVDCLALIDAIDVSPPIVPDGGVPWSVRYLIHGYRSWAANSRRLWGNCGTRSMNRADVRTFLLTHWGASGCPLQEGIPPGLTGGDFVTEYDYYREADRATNVRWATDIASAAQLWKWMNGLLHHEYIKLGGDDIAIQHVVAEGESLSVISEKNYGDPLLWLILYDANYGEIGDDPNTIEPGTRLRVPVVNTYTPEELNNIREMGRNWRRY